MADQVGPVRVLVVHPRDLAAPTGGGIQTFLHDFVAHSPTDFEIAVFGLTADPRARPVGRWTTVTIGTRQARFLPIARMGSSARHPFGIPRTIRALAILRREARDSGAILQVHRPYRHFLLDRHRGPRVQVIHLDLGAWPGPTGWRRLAWLYRDFADRLDRFDRVFVVNEAGALMLRHLTPLAADRIEFLSGWYDGGLFHPPGQGERPRIRERVAARFGLSAESSADRWVLFVGRLHPVKDPGLALESFAELLRTTSRSAQLIVCGGGAERAALETQAADLGVAERTHFLGDQPREVVAELMAAADVLLVTSKAEGGGPRVVLEALGSGLPVVSTVVGEVRRSVTTGRSGWLAESWRPDTLAEGLRWALEQPRDEVAATAFEASLPFESSAVLGRVYDTYRELANTTRSRPSRFAR